METNIYNMLVSIIAQSDPLGKLLLFYITLHFCPIWESFAYWSQWFCMETTPIAEHGCAVMHLILQVIDVEV